MNRHLIATLTPNYIGKALPFLRSVGRLRSLQQHLILLDFGPHTDPDGRAEAQLREVLHWMDLRKMALPPTHSNFMVQDCFLTAFPDITDNELVILSDADIVVQRDLTEDEVDDLDFMADSDTIGVWWNAGETDSLAWEAQRIGLSPEWAAKWGPKEGLQSIHCMNCGVQVARAGVFRKVQEVYEEHYEEFFAATVHRSRCQFLLNWCWHKLNLYVQQLPPTIHIHGHCTTEDGAIVCAIGTEDRFGVVSVKDVEVVFKHLWPQ